MSQHWKSRGDRVYERLGDGKFFEKVKIGGKWTFRLLSVCNVTAARELARKNQSNQSLAQAGVAGVKDPYANNSGAELSSLFNGWIEANCPGKKQRTKSGKQLDQELSRIGFLRSFWDAKRVDQIEEADCVTYWESRQGQIRKGMHGGRAVDMELGTLCSCLGWALHTKRIKRHPLTHRPKFRGTGAAAEIVHCRERMPKSAHELHKLAREFFSRRGSEVLGWQLLFEAFTGCRTSEALRMRWDAEEGQAGYIEGNSLYLERSKKGINPEVEIHPALAQLLEAMKQWRTLRGIDSPWFFPGKDKTSPVKGGSLSKALARVAPDAVGHDVISHGLRAYYVTVRRSQGINDGQIAWEIGDKSGPAIISSTYGDPPPSWKTGGKKLEWMTPDPAWMALALQEVA